LELAGCTDDSKKLVEQCGAMLGSGGIDREGTLTAVISTLGGCGSAACCYVELFADMACRERSEQIRTAALKAISNLAMYLDRGRSSKTVEKIMDSIQDGRPAQASVQALRHLSAARAQAAPQIRSLLHQRGSSAKATFSLVVNIGAETNPYMNEIITLVRGDPHSYLPLLEDSCLISKDLAASLALEFSEWVEHKTAEVRYEAIKLVNVLGPQAPQCINYFVKLFHDEDHRVRCSAARSLRHFGDHAYEHASCLVDLCSKCRNICWSFSFIQKMVHFQVCTHHAQLSKMSSCGCELPLYRSRHAIIATQYSR